MAHLGHHVLGIDTRTEQVEALSQGRAPFYEPGLPELLITGAQQGDLRFTQRRRRQNWPRPMSTSSLWAPRSPPPAVRRI